MRFLCKQCDKTGLGITIPDHFVVDMPIEIMTCPDCGEPFEVTKDNQEDICQ